ncbi:MAG: hypothetical protein KatS3mg051_0703 [Anaerolineae bacterium]|nr:MAG: hypothetical protein KatS3mg051_0703 [Anaerolineae bacterium]
MVAVAVLYSMLTSEAYRRVIQALTDNPQTSTEDLFEVVQVVGEPAMVTGTLRRRDAGLGGHGGG